MKQKLFGTMRATNELDTKKSFGVLHTTDELTGTTPAGNAKNGKLRDSLQPPWSKKKA